MNILWDILLEGKKNSDLLKQQREWTQVSYSQAQGIGLELN